MCIVPIHLSPVVSPSVNRHQETDKDAAEWLPDLNQCWYVDRAVQIRLEHGLAFNQADADVIDTVPHGSTPAEMVVLAPTTAETSIATATLTPTPGQAADTLTMYDDNNARINCADPRAHDSTAGTPQDQEILEHIFAPA